MSEAEDEAQDEERVRTKMRDILVATANALKGEPGPLKLHSWHDLADVAAALTKRKDVNQQLLEACKAQHEAIDYLFALLINLTSSGCVPTKVFYPSESGQPWDAIQMGKKAIEAAGSG